MIPSNLDELYDWLHWRPARKPVIVAHRGAPEPDEAENCLATFDLALQRGAQVMEIDLQLTSDDHLVLGHDRLLDRCTTGHGPLSEHTLAQLQQLRLRNGRGEPLEQRIVTFAQVLEWARGRALLYLDPKPPVPYARVHQEIRQHQALHLGITLTYTLDDALLAHRSEPRGAIYGMAWTAAAAHALLDSGIAHRQLLINARDPQAPQDIYDLIHEHAICVDFPAWSGPDSQADQHGPVAFQAAVTHGADLFNTDRVSLVRQALERFSRQPNAADRTSPPASNPGKGY